MNIPGPTATELMNDPAFWKRRMMEQFQYITAELLNRNRSAIRKIEIMKSANEILTACHFKYYCLEAGLTGYELDGETVRQL